MTGSINTELIFQMIMMGFIIGVFTSLFVQKFKEFPIITQAWQVVSMSLILNLLFGFGWVYLISPLFSLTVNGIIMTIYIGLIAFIGADAFYKALEEKWDYFIPLGQTKMIEKE